MSRPAIALVSVAAITGVALIWSHQRREAGKSERTATISVNADVAHDVSEPLSATGGLNPPDDDDPDANVTGAFPAVKITRALGVDIEQHAQGAKAAPVLVASFDGLGIGFQGPQGVGRGNNPSDNSLAVGPDHIVAIVNGRGMAIFSKKGKKFDTTGKVLYGPVASNNVFKGFTGNCEARNSGDVVVRYDQLADRWLIVLPEFSRGPARPDQPVGTHPSDPAAVSVPGVAGQPGAAAPLFQPPPPQPPAAPGGAPGAAPGAPPARGGGAGGGGGAPAAQGPYSMCYAVSVGPDPFGPYYRYEFLRAYFPDYPRPAVWPDGYYVPSSTSDNRIADSIATQKHACVADRAKMLKGEPATEQCVIVENVNFLNNADVDGKTLPPTGAPNIMVAAGGRQLDNILEDSILNVWQFHVDWKDPTKTKVTGPQRIAVAPYHYLCDGQLKNCVPQPGTEQRLDSQGDKLMARVVYRRIGNRESIVAVHSINTAEGAGGVRWYELRVGANRAVSLYQQGTYAPDSAFRWLGSPAMDRNGNIGIGYSYGSPTAFPGQRFVGRLANDPLGQLTLHEAVLINGEAAQTGAAPFRNLRWEDYSQTAVDPSDDCTIWYLGDYYKQGASSYSSRIGGFQMPGCGR